MGRRSNRHSNQARLRATSISIVSLSDALAPADTGSMSILVDPHGTPLTKALTGIAGPWLPRLAFVVAGAILLAIARSILPWLIYPLIESNPNLFVFGLMAVSGVLWITRVLGSGALVVFLVAARIERGDPPLPGLGRIVAGLAVAWGWYLLDRSTILWGAGLLSGLEPAPQLLLASAIWSVLGIAVSVLAANLLIVGGRQVREAAPA